MTAFERDEIARERDDFDTTTIATSDLPAGWTRVETSVGECDGTHDWNERAAREVCIACGKSWGQCTCAAFIAQERS